MVPGKPSSNRRPLEGGDPGTVALCSLPPIGEDPSSAHPFQRELNRRIEEYSGIIKDIARKAEVGYLAVHEAMLAQIQSSPGRAFTCFRLLPFYRDAFGALMLRKSPDQIGQMNGWRFHADGVHLNSRGGMIVAGLVQEFIDR